MDPQELERIIEKVDGIRAVKVVGEGESIKEIHVIASASKNPKQVVRDIETAVFALTGYKLDRKIVSVAQIEDEDLPGKRARIGLINVEVEESGLNVKVRVELNVEGEEVSGESSGPRTSSRLPITIGEAVIDALSDSSMAVSMDDVQIAVLHNREYVLSHLTCFDGKNEWEVIGVSPMGEDANRSIALSVIDAMEKIL